MEQLVQQLNDIRVNAINNSDSKTLDIVYIKEFDQKIKVLIGY